MSAVIGSLRADLSMRSAAFNAGVDAATKKLNGLRRSFRKIGRDLETIGQNMALSVSAPLIGLAYKSVAAQKEQERAIASVTAALESMGNGAGYTLSKLEAMASKLQENSLYGDEEILGKVTANLLTFGNVQGEVFARAQQSALDLSARLGQDLQSSALMLGKALNDPVQGLTALSRVGVSFAEQQKEQIRTMAKAGDVAGAQALMLAELERQYKGQAAALAETDSGRVTQVLNAIGDATEKIGAVILPLLADVASHVQRLVERFQGLSPEVQKLVVVGGAVAAAIGPLALIAAALATSFSVLAPMVVAATVPLAGLGAVAGVVTLAWEPLIGAVQFLRDNIYLLAPVIGKLTLSLGSLLVSAVGSAATGILGLASALAVKLVGALGFASKGLRTFRAALVSTGIGAIVVAIGLAVQKFMELVEATGGVGNALTYLKALAVEVWDRIGLGVSAASAHVQARAQDMRAGIFENLGKIVDHLPGFVNPIIRAFDGAFGATKAIWSGLPHAMANVVKEAGNLAISGLENMINFARRGISNFMTGVASMLNSIPGVNIPIEPLAPVVLDKIKIEATSIGQDVQAALVDAAGRNYLKEWSQGLGDLASEARAASDELAATAKAQFDAADKPLPVVQALAEAQRMLKKQNKETGDSVSDVSSEVDKLNDALQGAGDAGAKVGKGVGGGAKRAASSLKKVKDQAEELRKSLGDIFGDVIKKLSSGSLADAFSSALDALKNKAAGTFSDLVKGAFSAKGGGFSGLFGGLKKSWSGFTSGLSGVFSGGGLASSLGALGGAIGSVLPVIGAVSAAINLVKGFSSKKVIGGGINLGISGGDVAGGTFDRVQRKTFWGLFSRKYDRNRGFDAGALQGLRDQLGGVREAVRTTYGALGRAVSDVTLNAVNLAVRRIDTKGLSKEEVQQKVNAVFAEYGDALSSAIGGVGLQLAGQLAQVQAVLSPLGKAFSTWGQGALAASAYAADALVKLSGGVDALSQKSASFYASFFSEQEKLDEMRRRVGATLSHLGLAMPGTREAFKGLVLAQDLMTQSGRKAYAALLDVAPMFDELAKAADSTAKAAQEAAKATEAAVQAMRGAYSLDSSRYATEFEAKLAYEMANQGAYGADVISAQNEQLRHQSDLLARIEQLLRKQGRATEDGLTLAGFS